MIFPVNVYFLNLQEKYFKNKWQRSAIIALLG